MENYIGELRVFASGKIPRDWVACNGQLLNISQNAALYSLLGTAYGGDGIITFGLPDLRGRTMVSLGTSSYAPKTDFVRGEAKGAETVNLIPGELPTHTHLFGVANGQGNTQLAIGTSGSGFLASQPQVPQIPDEDIAAFTPNISAGNTRLHDGSIETAGDSQPHENLMPYLTLNVCIALSGIYPPRN